jgi:hypothetical protein
MTEFNIMELIVGPLAEGQSVDLSDIKMADILARFEVAALRSSGTASQR